MNLKNFLITNKISQLKFSKTLGVHHMTIHQILSGRRTPSRKLAAIIEQATGGQVSRLELLYPENKEGDCA